MNRRISLKKEDHDPLPYNTEIDGEDTPGNSYVPSVLPEWKDWCSHNAKKERRPICLDLENMSVSERSVSRVGWKGRVEHALGHIEKSSELDENLLACLLECVITTVIGLASDQVLSEEYLFFSLLYLRNIKGEFGEIPPNIVAFMELITGKLSKEGRDVFEKLTEADLASVPPNVVITRLTKSLQNRQRK